MANTHIKVFKLIRINPIKLRKKTEKFITLIKFNINEIDIIIQVKEKKTSNIEPSGTCLV